MTELRFFVDFYSGFVLFSSRSNQKYSYSSLRICPLYRGFLSFYNRILQKIKYKKKFNKNKQRFWWDSRYHISPEVGVRWGLFKLWGYICIMGEELSQQVCFSVLMSLIGPHCDIDNPSQYYTFLSALNSAICVTASSSSLLTPFSIPQIPLEHHSLSPPR